MTYIPNVREEGPYNEGNLKHDSHKDFVAGYDAAVEQIKLLFEGNLECFELEYDGDIDIMKVLDKASEEIVEMIDTWAESERNMIVVSFLDDEYVDEEE